MFNNKQGSLDPPAGVWWWFQSRLHTTLTTLLWQLQKTCLNEPPFYCRLCIIPRLQHSATAGDWTGPGCVPAWMRRHLSSVGSWGFLNITNNWITMFLTSSFPFLPPTLISNHLGYVIFPRCSLWETMSEDTQEQPSRKPFTSQHAILLDISYWLNAAADWTDLMHPNIPGVSYQSEDR